MTPASDIQHPPISPIARQLLAEFAERRQSEVVVWARSDRRWSERYPGSAPDTPTDPPEDAVESTLPDQTPIAVAVRSRDGQSDPATAQFVATLLTYLFRHETEARFFGRELAERYEEITLLYSISETLGSIISLSESAAKILADIVDTLEARRAALWVLDGDANRLELLAAVGGGQDGPIDLDDSESITASVFRERRAVILDPGDEFPRREKTAYPKERGSFLSVPVSFTPPGGKARMIGVINLIGRRNDGAFSAGDLKLLSAIASQVGAAVENRRLVDESLRRERFAREMELANDLQLKLLPPLDQFEGYAEVAARCEPADSVGGDFYHLFRLTDERIGVMIGDVAGHGFSAAMIMALTMSAVAIHAAETDSPGEVLRRTHRALIDELRSTEMYMTLFYGIIDPKKGVLTYANAGHPHAFQVRSDGSRERLGATHLPIGLVEDDDYPEATLDWNAGSDVLMLFTDGLSDAIGDGERNGETTLLDALSDAAGEPLAVGLERLFSLVGARQSPPDDRTAVLVRI